MSKKIKILYIIDFIIFVTSGIGLIIVSNSKNYGLAALTSLGNFVVLGLIFLASILLFVIISIICIIKKLKKST